MLTVGDRVVYPMHGAGIIEAIEEHEILGQTQRYFVLTMPYGGMRVMIPLKNVENIGLREVICAKEVEHVIDVLRKPASPVQASWNRRFNVNLDKIKKLSTGERRLLNTARQILVSELVLACNKDAGHIETWLDTLFDENAPGN